MGAYEKYVSTKGRPDGGAFIMKNGVQLCQSVLRSEESIFKGSNFFSVVWYINPGAHDGPDDGMHVHEFDEYVGFIGSDPYDYKNLNGLIRFWIDGEWIELTQSCVMFIPAGVPHCPYEIVRVDKPIIHFAGSGSHDYIKIGTGEEV